MVAGCATVEPFPPSLEIGLAQVESQSPDCFPLGDYAEPGVFVETKCGGYYPASLYDNGVEASCITQFDLAPGDLIDVYAVQCNVALDRHEQSASSFSPGQRAIAKAMFIRAATVATEAMSIRLDGLRAQTGRLNVTLPMVFLIEGGD